MSGLYWLGVLVFAVLYANGMPIFAWIVGGFVIAIGMKAQGAF